LARTGNYARDTAIDIFNRFVATVSLESGLRLVDNPTFVSFAAAVSLILASKVHEGKTQALTMSKFPDFKTEDLIAFESMMLSKLECKISALSTPTAFISTLVELWPDRSHHTPLKEKAEEFLAYFYEAPESTIYAPSTLAISVLLLAFSVLQLDCSSWLANVPDVCFPRHDSPAVFQGLQSSFDIDACIVHIQSICAADPAESPLTLPGCGAVPPAAISPTSVVLSSSPEAGAAGGIKDGDGDGVDGMDLADEGEFSDLAGVMTTTFTPARGARQGSGVVKATGGKPVTKVSSGHRSRADSSPRDPELYAIEADGFNASYPLLRSRSRQQQQHQTAAQLSVFRPIAVSLGMPLI
jgi:hypothetical protein